MPEWNFRKKEEKELIFTFTRGGKYVKLIKWHFVGIGTVLEEKRPAKCA